LPHHSLRPGTVGDELLELLAVNAKALGHRLDRFTLAWHQQPLHIERSALVTLATPNPRDQRLYELLQFEDLSPPLFWVPFHAQEQ
jgi:hypothetical protein